MKKHIVIIIFIFIICISFNFFFSYSNADTGTLVDGSGSSSSTPKTDMDSIISSGQSFIKRGKLGEASIETIDGFTFRSAVSNIYNILLVLGIAISVIISGVMGIKIMIGSAEEKAEIKEQMVPYIIGCGVMFGALAIWKIVMIIAGAVS